MQNYDEMFEELKEMEATIQKRLGEKNVLTRQMEQYKQELSKDEAECLEKFGCSLGELSKKKSSLMDEITELFNGLKEKLDQIG